MSEEPLDRKTIFRNRWMLLAGALVFAGGIVWAIRAESDAVAVGLCLVVGIALNRFTTNSEERHEKPFQGIIYALFFFLIWMSIKFIILND